jgi:hypothetical protein
MANRVLRFVQRPAGVYHSSVFHQFSGRLGPSALAVDADGNLYVARYDFSGGCWRVCAADVAVEDVSVSCPPAIRRGAVYVLGRGLRDGAGDGAGQGGPPRA